ncbi:MAG: citrate synthase [Deltaproteobacteria bacterium]|nr:citrate synthase [Deltaproteobacteria bacterium]
MSVEYVPGLAGIPATRSKIGLIDGQRGKLSYRGYDVEELADGSSYEEVAYLLFSGELPSQGQLDDFVARLRNHRRLKFRIIDMLKALPEVGHPMDALAATFSAVGMFYPPSIMDTPAGRWGSAIRILTKVPTMVAAFHRIRGGDEPLKPRDDLGHAANFLYMMTEQEPDPLVAKVLDVCLILHAEHGMNASTFAARVSGSTLTDPFAVISAATATLAGPLHGGANEDVLDMLRAIPGGKAGVRKWAEEQVSKKQKVPGFGHRVYKVKDPRAKILQKLAGQIFDKFGSTPLYDIAQELERVMEELVGGKGVYPNVDFYSGIVYEKMQIPSDIFTPIFAIARTAGWLSHWLEQLENNRIFRPSQIYEGDVDLSYKPIADR